MELSCVTAGQGPPLVLLHGFTGNHTSWEEWLPELEQGRSVLAVDLPGHGGTDIDREDPSGGLAAVAAALDRLLEAHAIQQADFIGYSMGGRALLHFAHLFPHRVTSMVILSASPGIEDANEREERARADDALADRIETHGLERFVTEWMEQPLFQTLALADPARVARERSRKLSGDAGRFAEALRQMSPGRQLSLWSSLGEMRIPSLIAAGSLDKKYVAMAHRMADLLPEARAVVIPEAGHALLLEKPAEIAAAVADFEAERASS